MSYFTDIAESIKAHESYRPRPYPDPITGGKPWTIGYGFTYLSPDECEAVLEIKIRKIARKLLKRIPNFISYPMRVKMVLIEMAYQMGVAGLLEFHDMLAALDRGDYDQAAAEIRNSKLYRQTRGRAEWYAKMIGRQRCQGNP